MDDTGDTPVKAELIGNPKAYARMVRFCTRAQLIACNGVPTLAAQQKRSDKHTHHHEHEHQFHYGANEQTEPCAKPHFCCLSSVFLSDEFAEDGACERHEQHADQPRENTHDGAQRRTNNRQRARARLLCAHYGCDVVGHPGHHSKHRDDRHHPRLDEKQAKAEGGEIHWGDETALVNTDVRGRSYGPHGQNSVTMAVGGTREKLSTISTVTNQGKSSWVVIEDAFNAQRLIEFLEALVSDGQSRNKKVFLILDNLRVHDGKLVKA